MNVPDLTINERKLIENIEYYYNLSLNVMEDFGGPSIYFHVQSIKEQQINFLSDRHIEMIYATLASWGMHRMGNPDNTRTRMKEFSVFKNSILLHSDNLHQFSLFRMDHCTMEEYKDYINRIEEVYCDLKVSVSNATIVAHSKTLAHILPNLIPPIDRKYTIRFFTQDNENFFYNNGKYKIVKIPDDQNAQFSDFKKYCCRIKNLFDLINHQLFVINPETFNTSFPKIMDNLIMAFVKDVRRPNNA